MKRHNLEYELQMNVRKYISFLHEINLFKFEKENEVVDQLSNSLKEEVLLKANENIVKSLSLFTHNFTESTLRRVILSMKQIRIAPGEIINQVIFFFHIYSSIFLYFIQGIHQDDKCINIIGEGEIALKTQDTQTSGFIFKKLKVRFL